MAGMRDRLIHNYVDVDYAIVWDVAETKVPELARQLRSVIDFKDVEGAPQSLNTPGEP